MFGKIVSLFLLRKTISASSSLLESLLAGMAAIALLSLVAALLLGVLILGGIYVTYQGLLAHGVAAQTAALITGTGIFCVLIVTILVILSYIAKIQALPKSVAQADSPLTSRVSRIADAFLSGFHTQ